MGAVRKQRKTHERLKKDINYTLSHLLRHGDTFKLDYSNLWCITGSMDDEGCIKLEVENKGGV
jgi:hypothetical protein